MSDTAGGDDPVEEARAEVVEALGRSAEVYGLKRSYGRLYGELLFADESLSLDELVERSGYAKSTVSTAMSALQRFHLVKRRSIPGEGKKAYYEADDDFWNVFQQLLDSEVRREIQIMSRALDDAEAKLERADDERADDDLKTIRGLKGMYDHGETAVSVLTSQSLERVTSVLARLKPSS